MILKHANEIALPRAMPRSVLRPRECSLMTAAAWLLSVACSSPSRTTTTAAGAVHSASVSGGSSADQVGGPATESDAGRRDSEGDGGFAQPSGPLNHEAARHAADGAAAFARGDFTVAAADF